jgi:predicted amidohydrolase YtcJ
MLKKLLALSLISLFLLPSFVMAQTKQNISLLLYNGKVFSADKNRTMYEAVAVDGEKIVEVGNSKDLQAKYNAKQAIDLKGNLVTPGFNDAHIHFVGVGLALLRVDLVGSKTLAEAKQRIAAKIKELPKGAWVLGRGWDHTLWGNKLPTRADLDDISPDNPVFVQRVDGHISWSNSLAFKLAKVTKDSKAPTGGEIVFDKNGEPEGVLKETAQGLVSRVVPETTNEETLKGLELAIDEAKKYGLTSVQGGADYEAIPLYKQLLEQNKLTTRVAVWQNFELSVETLKKQRADFQALKLNPSRLKLGILKGYMDGTLGSRTAAMLAPFSDDPNNSGIPRRDPDEMIKMIVERDAAGFQIGLHAIGDRANRIALDGIEKALKENGLALEKVQATNIFKPINYNRKTDSKVYTKRHRIEHAQVVAPSDFKRFAELGIIASMQPSHAISDKRWAGDRLGEYRTLGAYSWHTFMANNVHVAFGTDAPVESLDTYQTLYAAVSRQDLDGDPLNGWQPQEKLPMEDAIRNYTYESAYAEFAENEKGTIEVGKFADLVVHSKNLLTIPHKEILETRPVYTIFNGKIVYEK